MNNLELYKYSLLQHNLPFIIEKGIVRSISAYIPWTSFFSAPTTVSISDVQVVLSCLLRPDKRPPSPAVFHEIVEHLLSALEQFKSTARLLLKIITPNFLYGLLAKICGIIKISIDRVNVVINCGAFCLGIHITGIVIDDFVGETEEKIARGVNVDQNVFSQEMMNSFHGRHSFVVEDAGLRGPVFGGPRIRSDFEVSELSLHFEP
jgi:hypothetical protein